MLLRIRPRPNRPRRGIGRSCSGRNGRLTLSAFVEPRHTSTLALSNLESRNIVANVTRDTVTDHGVVVGLHVQPLHRILQHRAHGKRFHTPIGEGAAHRRGDGLIVNLFLLNEPVKLMRKFGVRCLHIHVSVSSTNHELIQLQPTVLSLRLLRLLCRVVVNHDDTASFFLCHPHFRSEPNCSGRSRVQNLLSSLNATTNLSRSKTNYFLAGSQGNKCANAHYRPNRISSRSKIYTNIGAGERQAP